MTVYLDTETTGLDDDDEIIEIGIVDAEGRVLVSTLVRPTHHSEWPEAEAINGISPAMVADAPTLAEVEDSIEAAVDGQAVVIYNSPLTQFLAIAVYLLVILVGVGIFYRRSTVPTTWIGLLDCLLAHYDPADRDAYRYLQQVVREKSHTGGQNCIDTSELYRWILQERHAILSAVAPETPDGRSFLSKTV